MNDYHPDNPLIVQGDNTVLVEVGSPRYADARDGLLQFAELVKSPEHVHTYRITPLSIWNARAAGVAPEAVEETLTSFAKFPVPDHVLRMVREQAARYGRLRLEHDGDELLLIADSEALATEVAAQQFVSPFLREPISPVAYRVNKAQRGWLKQTLIKLGFPVEDIAGYATGEHLALSLRDTMLTGPPFALRHYQRQAVEAFHAAGTERGGSGVVVLPCGAGKTVVGMAVMARLQFSTLILTTSISAARQWLRELLDKTTLTEDEVGEYTGYAKEVCPVTVATYQMLTHRTRKDDGYRHLELFDRRNWGLIIYDEVHLLPAPVFRATADLQARRRLGLTATLVREDGHEDDVFALVGPKKADVPWKELEREGWIATATCTEVRVPMTEALRLNYALADRRKQFRIAAENEAKIPLIKRLLARHPDSPTLVIGMYVEQMKRIAEELEVPLLSGSTAAGTRERLFGAFRDGSLPVLAVTKVANFAIDLPDAAVAIQVSGTFGSRQEEAQRLGRILRPKSGANQAFFYSLVSSDSSEQDFALRRQLFLCEQGYAYGILDPEDL